MKANRDGSAGVFSSAQNGRRAGGRPRGRIAGAGVLIATLVLCLLPGCGDDPAPTGPAAPDSVAIPEGCGRIQGILSGGFGPLSGSVEALNPNTGQNYRTTTDSTGFYRLDVPRANYRLFVTPPDGVRRQWMPDGPRSGPGWQIMLTWENRSVRVDAKFGALRWRMPLTEACDEAPDYVEFRRYGDDGHADLITRKLDVLPHDGLLDLTADGLLPGPYEIYIRRGGQYYLEPRYPGGYETFIQVEAEACADWVSALPMPAKIRGRLTGPWEQLVPEFGDQARPTVHWLRVHASYVYGSGESGPVGFDGSFCLDMLLPDSVRVFVGAPAFWSHWIGGMREPEATVFVPRSSETLDLGDLPGAAVGFRVSRGSDQPLGLFRVYLMADETEVLARSYEMRETWRESMVKVAFSHLEPGTYYLRVKPQRSYGVPPWPEQWYPGVLDFAQAQAIELRSIEEAMTVDWLIAEAGKMLPVSSGDPGDEAQPR